MVFLSPLFLLGLLAVSLPIIIHLFYRRKVRNIRFSSLLLLREIIKRYSARQKLHEILVLLLRCAAIGMVAFALAKPALKTSFLSSSAPCACAIVFDDTYSMAYGSNAVNRLTRARQASIAVLRTLSRRDSAAVFLVSAPDEVLSAQDIGMLTETVNLINVSYKPPRFEEAIKRAGAFLKDAQQLNRQLVIIGDMQENTYGTLANKELENQIPENVQVIFIDIGDDDATNAAVTEVKTFLDFRYPKEICVEAKIQNFSGKEMNLKPVLSYGEQKRPFKSVTLLPSTKETVRFYVPSSAIPKETGACFSIEEDGLDIDNRFYLPIGEVKRIKVLVVNGDPSPLPELDELFYIRIALAPFDPTMGISLSDIEPTLIPYFQLERVKFTDYRAVILANVQSLSNVTVKRLEDFVRGGGGLLIFSGERLAIENYNNWLGELAGVRLLEKKSFEEPLILDSVDYTHPVFRALAPVAAETVPLARFWRIMRTEPLERKANIIATYSNGDGAVFEYLFGKGKVLFLTMTCDRDWTNLPIRTVFVPLVQALTRYSVGASDEQWSFVVGEEIRVRIESDVVSLVRPDGSTTEMAARMEGSERVVRFIPDVPGVYILRDGAKEMLFGVNAEREESELARISKEALPKSDRFHYLASGTEIEAFLERLRMGVKLWDYFLYAALGFLLAELVLSNRRLPSFKKEGKK